MIKYLAFALFFSQAAATNLKRNLLENGDCTSFIVGSKGHEANKEIENINLDGQVLLLATNINRKSMPYLRGYNYGHLVTVVEPIPIMHRYKVNKVH